MPVLAFDQATVSRAPGQGLPCPDDGWVPPQEFDGYQLRSLLGAGAMGKVYLAYDTVLDRSVAIKFITSSSSARRRERFLREARAAARLSHPNVVALYRIGEAGSCPYLVTEFVRGKPLDQLELPLEPEALLRVAIGLSRGLAAAHRVGLLHRDLKPANAMLSEDGEVKLLDFGLAVLVGDDDRTPAPGSPRLASVSQTGMLVGTPAYMSPELWRGERGSLRSDVYALGAVLHHLATGRPPHQAPSLPELGEQILHQDAAPLKVGEELGAVISRALARDAAVRHGSGEELREALEALAPERRRRALPPGNPYRGLSAFDFRHRALFFGREPEVRGVVERLRSEALVVVAGTSGVGKSSLCRAGVLPHVVDGDLEDGRAWRTATLTPGQHPRAALISSVAEALGDEEAAIRSLLRGEPLDAIRELRGRLGRSRGLLLLVDQLEELVTLSSEQEARWFAELLEELSGAATNLRVLASCRGDFIARVGAGPGMRQAVGRALYLLRPMGPEHLRRAIVEPVMGKGLRFESQETVESLIASAGRSEGALPLLQFALAELWEVRDEARGVIPAIALERIGGMEGALARHADAVIAHLRPEEALAARSLLVQLVTADGTRSRKLETELTGGAPAARVALDALVQSRLLVASETAQGPAYEVAHEALIRSWPMLSGWLAEDSDRRAARERLTLVAMEWERSGSRHLLWTFRQQTETLRAGVQDLGPREQAFLVASRAAARRQRQLRWSGVVLLVAAAVAGALLVRHSSSRAVQARLERVMTTARLQLEQGRRLGSAASVARAEAFAAFEAGQLEQGEARWALALSGADQAERALTRASDAAEGALGLSSHSDATIALLAEVLFERARLAQELGQTLRLEELSSRLRVYDPDGSWLSRLTAPVRVSFRSNPPGAQLWLSGGEGRLALGAAPLERELQPGFYSLQVVVPGRPPVHLPFLVGRGAPNALEITVPERLPEGLVYIPGGAFLAGSNTDESLRRDFLRAPPLHVRESDSFLIGRQEVTFAEYLVFLESIPARERSRRTPRISAGGFGGGVGLAQTRAGWTLQLQPGPTLHRAMVGEALVFPDRPEAARRQEWLRMPVVGLTAEDAEAYLGWLSRTGRVPGARMCSELEWERAARGADGRSFPGGDTLAADAANFDETYGKQPTAMAPDEVGSHPDSRSPFGLEDMAGNVWEWTRSTRPDATHVAKGGSFSFGRSSARADNRELIEAGFRDVTLGLRICADAE